MQKDTSNKIFIVSLYRCTFDSFNPKPEFLKFQAGYRTLTGSLHDNVLVASEKITTLSGIASEKLEHGK